MHIHRTLFASVAGVIVGALYVTLCYRVPWLIHLRPLYHFGLSFAMLLPISLALVATAQGKVWLIPLFVAVGISIGVIADVSLDENDRNIFPIEIVFWSAFLAPGVLVGAAVGESIRKPRNDSLDGNPLNAAVGAMRPEHTAILPPEGKPGIRVAHDLRPLTARGESQ